MIGLCSSIGVWAAEGAGAASEGGVVAGTAVEVSSTVVQQRAGANAALIGFLGAGAVVCLAVLRRRGDLRRAALDRRLTTGEGAGAPPSVWIASAFLVWMAWQLGGGIVMGLLPRGAPPAVAPGAEVSGAAVQAALAPRTLREHALISLGAEAAGLLALLAAIVALRRRDARERWAPRWRDLGIGLGALLLAAPFVLLAGFFGAVAHALITGRPPDRVAHTTLALLFDEPLRGADRAWAGMLMLSAAIGAPLREEFIYRGFLQSAALRWLRNGWGAVLVTSAVFTAAHIGAASWHALGGLFTLGVALGVVRERSASVWPCVVMHAGFNAVNLGAAWIGA